MVRRVRGGAFAAPELDRSLRGSGFAGRDRALVTDLVYGALRHRRWLDAALAPRLRAPERLPESVDEALRLGAFEKLVRGTPAHAAVGEWVEAVRAVEPRLAGLANAVLRRVEPPHDPSPAVRHALPDWLWRSLVTLLGERAGEAAAGMLQPEPLWLTVFPDDAGGEAAERVAEALRAEGAEAQPGPLPGSLRVRPGRPLAELSAYAEGRVQPQNPASLWVARALGAQADERVLDLAGGRGVKAAVLASQGAQVDSLERSSRNIAAARGNLRRLGVSVAHREVDLRHVPAGVEPAAAVLLDAPCSGTGTLRGHPEIKMRLLEEHLEAITATQDALLDSAAELTREGGRLLYAVCALTPAEGPERVTDFLSRHPTFRAEPLEPPLPHVRAGPGVALLSVDGLDGFYLARLRREPGVGGREQPARSMGEPPRPGEG